MFFVDAPVEENEMIEYFIHDNQDTLICLTDKGQDRAIKAQDSIEDLEEYLDALNDEFDKFEWI